jgi:hypothetical protein
MRGLALRREKPFDGRIDDKFVKRMFGRKQTFRHICFELRFGSKNRHGWLSTLRCPLSAKGGRAATALFAATARFVSEI